MKEYITEISEQDFRKLNLSYVVKPFFRNRKIESYPMQNDMNEILDEAIRLIESEGLRYSTVAILVHTEAGEFDGCYWDKYYCPTPSSIMYGVSVKKVYSKHNNWYIASDLESFSVPKVTTKAVYLIHLDENKINCLGDIKKD